MYVSVTNVRVDTVLYTYIYISMPNGDAFRNIFYHFRGFRPAKRKYLIEMSGAATATWPWPSRAVVTAYACATTLASGWISKCATSNRSRKTPIISEARKAVGYDIFL